EMPPLSRNAARNWERQVKPGSILAMWKDRPTLDNIHCAVLAVAREELSDFFAFVSTYVSIYRPFTAYFRVIETQLVEEFELASEWITNNRALLSKIAAGTSLAEGHWRSGEGSGKDDYSLANLSCSLSNVVAGAMIAGYGDESTKTAIKRWTRLQLPNTSAESAALAEAMYAVWTSIVCATEGRRSSGRSGDTGLIGETVCDLVANGNVSSFVLEYWSQRFDVLRGMDAKMRGTREERVKFFNEALPSLLDTDDHAESRSFVVGLLLSMIGNGSFDHLSLATQFFKKLPAGLIWFGALASLHADSNVFTFKSGVAHRFARDRSIPLDLFGPSRADISAAEWTALSRSAGAIVDIPSVMNRAIVAEVLPGVEMLVRLGTEAAGARGGISTLTAEEVRELQYYLDRARRLLVDAGRPRQNDLFRTDVSPRRRR
ncbi:MAG: hypothetical protein JWO81_2703, partial [Alphaproteobacteria bacterium]|nr:hypothetical protein [Alphaproteobacteria bacterium]